MISAKIVADSISAENTRITTFELEYPRFIHSELMTHRLFSRNAASSRAIPIEKMMEQVSNNPASPIEFGLNQSGMQAKEEHPDTDLCIDTWKSCAQRAVESAKELQSLGLHKQVVNRVLEPFQLMKTVVTATEYDNFFWLRCHADAQPEIHMLANIMYELYEENEPRELEVGAWHLPYFGAGFWDDGYGYDYDIDLLTAIKVSASCCAQVSFRKNDQSIEKATMIYDRLVESTPVHASPFEHQATPVDYNQTEVPEGITSFDGEANVWSGNFKDWIQYRQTIDNNVCKDYNVTSD